MDSSVSMTGNVASPITFKSGEGASGQRWSRAEFRLASTRRRRLPDGDWGDAGTTFITVVAWRSLAEGVLGSLDKGDPVVVCGRLASDEWVDRNGELQSRLTLAAESIGHDLTRGRTRFAKNPAAPAQVSPDGRPQAPADVPDGAPEAVDNVPPETGETQLDADGYVPFDALEPAEA